jgi:hypothetical protein
MASYRARLDDVRATLGPEPPESQRFSVLDLHERWVLEWNDRRLAVLDHDVDAIIRSHAKDRKVAAWLEDTAQAFEEIGEIDLAIDSAKQATDFGRGHQSLKAADYWCKLLDEHLRGRILGSAASGLPALALLDDGSASARGRGKVVGRVSRRADVGNSQLAVHPWSREPTDADAVFVATSDLADVCRRREPQSSRCVAPTKPWPALIRQPARLAGRCSSLPQWGTERRAWVHKPWSESRR